MLSRLPLLAILLAPTSADDAAWPREIEVPEGTITIYQPELESYKDDKVTGRAAVSFRAKSADKPVFGAVWLSARAMIDRVKGTAEFVSLDVANARFPGAPKDKLDALSTIIERDFPTWRLSVPVAQLTIAAEGIEKEKAAAERLAAVPPKILVREHPAVLILIDGKPFLREGAGIKRVMNTPGFMAQDVESKTWYLRGGVDWYAAPEIEGPWKKVEAAPAAVQAAWNKEPGSAAAPKKLEKPAKDPEVLLSTEPAELIVTEGAPKWTPLAGTGLLGLDNTESSVLMEIGSQQVFVVLSGRWFTAATLNGPWTFVPADKLPADFQKIPTPGDWAEVRTHVAGTPEAREAVENMQVPQTAVVDRKKAKLEVVYDGAPQFKAIEGTAMEYAVNTAFSVLKIKGRYYCCHEGVWFTSPASTGPWEVATEVPKDVQQIPPENPCYHVKYCTIYECTPEYVYCGYYPGYVGCYVWGPTIVFGTGWYYGGWYGGFYYPRPVTYGFSFHYNSATGNWAVAGGIRGPWAGFGFVAGSGGNWAVGIGGGYWGGGGFGYVHIEDRPGPYANRGDVANASQLSEARTRERVQSGKRPADLPARQPSATPAKANDVFSDRDGNAYRKAKDGGWETPGGDGWTRPDTKNFESKRAELDRQYQSRERATQSYNRTRSAPSGGGGRRGGGGGRR
jgi:hypothetical protein